MDRAQLQYLNETYGIIRPMTSLYADDPQARRLAMDAGEQPQLSSTVANAGIPWFLTNILSPKAIRALVTPMTAVDIWGAETKLGDFTTLTTQIPYDESTGQVTSYGDYNDEGSTRANINWMPRQSYFFENIKRWGEREMALYGVARLDYAAKLDYASALVLAKFQNALVHYGATGLQLYGGLTDPNLSAPITPSTKANGGTQWIINGQPNATANEVFADITAIFYKTQQQLRGNVRRDAKMTLVMSPLSEIAMLTTNSFDVQVAGLVKKGFPNLTIKTAVEYTTAGGEFVQMIVDEIDGQRTAEPAFTEKMRSGPVIPRLSSFAQKVSGGSWGLILYRPLAVASMLGV